MYEVIDDVIRLLELVYLAAWVYDQTRRRVQHRSPRVDEDPDDLDHRETAA